MQIQSGDHYISISGVEDFNLTHTFTCGQCFRWNENPDKSYTGVAQGRVVRIEAQHNNITLYNTNLQEFHEIWFDYFDFSRNYAKIKQTIAKDEIMKLSVAHGWGIRILRQELFETLISFILSQCNHILRIKQITQRLCEGFGDRIFMDGKAYYTFPSAQRLGSCSLNELSCLRAGYRAKYVLDAAQKVASGAVDLQQLYTLPVADAKRLLMGISGVGHKVADCILLFGAGRMEVFPADTWINRAMKTYYPAQCAAHKTVREAGEQVFGRFCGLAQQYLFYYARGG